MVLTESWCKGEDQQRQPSLGRVERPITHGNSYEVCSSPVCLLSKYHSIFFFYFIRTQIDQSGFIYFYLFFYSTLKYGKSLFCEAFQHANDTSNGCHLNGYVG